jgi:outer membrane protein assembly factor BamA
MRLLAVISGFLLAAPAATAETRVRVTGMSGKSEREVLDLMGGRLVHVRASPASAHLADDAAFILRRILRKDGYATAEVDWKIASRDEIVLMVREGGRLSLGRVSVSGVPSDDARRLARIYSRPADRDRPIGLQSPPFREEDVGTGLSLIRQELNTRGHWSAEAEVSKRSTDPQSGRVDLAIEAKPGPLFRIGTPRVESIDGRGEKLTAETAQPFVGRAATTRNLNAMRAAVEERAVSRGYPDAEIRMSRALDGKLFVPQFVVDLGTRVRLREVRVTGLERTDPGRIEGRVARMEGDWYDEAAMNRYLREFLATGAFSSARVETEAAGDRLVDATLHFEEGEAREISLAAGLGSYQGFITRVTYGDRNLGGNLMALTAGLELGSRGVLGEVRITDPWLMNTDITASARVYAMIYGREGYLTYETGLEGTLSRSFGDHYKLDLSVGSSFVKVDGDGLPSSELGERTYTHPRLRLTQTLDYRDNPVLPKSGWHLSSPVQVGAALAGTSTTYLSAGLNGGWFHQLSRRTQIGLGGEWGILIPSGDGADLPIDLRLFNGGSRSVRSFPNRELGPLFNGYPTGGEAMWNCNAELIRSLSGVVKGVWFFDAGSLDRNYEDFGQADIELATGLGLRLELPIGPIRFEYGYNLTRDPGEPNGTFHFAIGNAF